MTVFCCFFLHDPRQFFDCLGRVYDTGRVIRCIDQNCCNIVCQHGLEFFKVNLESFQIRRNNFQLCSCQIDIRVVFREKRCKSKDGISRDSYCTECMCQSCCSTGAHENMFFFIWQTETFFQRYRYRLTHTVDTEARAVSMKSYRAFRLQQFDHFLCKFFRNRHRRITETVVKYILFSDLFCPFGSVSKHLTDYGFCS